MFESKHFTITLQTAPGEEADLPPEETQKLLEGVSRFRGDVINETIYIEYKLEKYLARNDPKKSDKLEKMTFAKKAKRFRSVAKEGPQDDLIYLVGFRNTLAHGKLIYEPQTGQLKIYNRKHSEWVVLTEALRAEIDEKVIRVDEFLNGLIAEQKPPERS
jgi:hypothetical protein